MFERTGVEEEGRAVARGNLVDLADEDGMVASGMSGNQFAVELDEGGFEERRTAIGSDEFDAKAFEFGGVLLRFGEEAGP